MMEDEASEGTSTYIAMHHEPVQYRTTRTHMEDQQDRWHINQSLESALSGEPILTDNRSLQMGPSVGQYIYLR